VEEARKVERKGGIDLVQCVDDKFGLDLERGLDRWLYDGGGLKQATA